MTGIVADSSGAILPGAKVAVKNLETGVVNRTATNDSGNYVVQNLIPGTYELTVGIQGFKTYVATNLRVQVGQVLRIDPSMAVGDVTESIAVTAAPPLVQTETGALGQTIDNRQIVQLPLNGRNIFGLVALVPGAAPDQSGNTRVNGARARGNEYMIDGVTQVTPVHRGGTALPPPPDANRGIQGSDQRVFGRVWQCVRRNDQRGHAFRHERFSRHSLGVPAQRRFEHS